MIVLACGNSAIAGIPSKIPSLLEFSSLRGFEEAEAISFIKTWTRLLPLLCSPSMTQGILDLALGILEFLKSLAPR